MTTDPIHLPADTQKQLRDSFRFKMGNLIFRRVQKVFAKYYDMIDVVCHAPVINTPKFEPIQMPLNKYKRSDHNNKIRDRFIEEKYRHFYGFTSNNGLRKNDPYHGHQIYFNSEKYCQLDMETFKFSENENFQRNDLLPQPFRNKHMPGDLLCMEVIPSNIKGRGPIANRWFICSEQFFRAWTYIMYDKHSSFIYNGKEPRMREKIMAGNTLNTNSYLKWVLAHKQNNMTVDEEEKIKRYTRMRTEQVSRRYIHVYSLLVLMTRYGELPTSENVPVNRFQFHYATKHLPTMRRWDLPSKYIQRILRTFTSFDPKCIELSWGKIEGMRLKYREKTVPQNTPSKNIITKNILGFQEYRSEKKGGGDLMRKLAQLSLSNTDKEDEVSFPDLPKIVGKIQSDKTVPIPIPTSSKDKWVDVLKKTEKEINEPWD